MVSLAICCFGEDRSTDFKVGFQSAPSALQHMKIEQANGGDVVMTSPTPSHAQAPKPKAGLDGMDALLRAGEIVGRGGHQ